MESVKLIDRYLKTETDINLTETSRVFFQAGSDSKSLAADRFSVIINKRKGFDLQGLMNKATIRAYPNPVKANGNINLQFEHHKEGLYKIELINNLGQTVYGRVMHLQSGTFSKQLNVGYHLPSGVYQMKITGKDSRTVMKIIVVK
jgi:hypothetical protein